MSNKYYRCDSTGGCWEYSEDRVSANHSVRYFLTKNEAYRDFNKYEKIACNKVRMYEEKSKELLDKMEALRSEFEIEYSYVTSDLYSSPDEVYELEMGGYQFNLVKWKLEDGYYD